MGTVESWNLKQIMASIGSLILAIVTMAVAVDSLLRSSYKDPRDSTCECTGSEEDGGKGGGPRGFPVKCGKTGDDFEFRRVREFRGNPHDCRRYNKNQQLFYDQLIEQIGAKMCTSTPPIPCAENNPQEYKTNLCGDLGGNKNFVFRYCNSKEALPKATATTKHYHKQVESCKCTGTEQSRSEFEPRSFLVKCERSGSNDEFKRIRVFEGNPDRCAEFKKNQETFYQELVDQIGAKMCAPPIPCDTPNPEQFVFQTDLCGNMGNNKNFEFQECKAEPGSASKNNNNQSGAGSSKKKKKN